MFILTYSTPTTGNVAELFATREAADAEAADVRRAMEAVGYGAHADSVRVQDTDGMTDAELWELPEDVQARIVAAEWEAHDRRIDARRVGGADNLTTTEDTVFTIDQALRYTGEAHVAPVNRTVTAPYGAHHDIVSFRRYLDGGRAEVMTSRGSRIVPLDMLAAR